MKPFCSTSQAQWFSPAQRNICTHDREKVRERERDTHREKHRGRERENTGQPQSLFLVWKCQHQREASLHWWGRAGGLWMFPCCRMNQGPKPNQEHSKIAWWLGGYGLTSYMSWSCMLLVPSGWPCLLLYTEMRMYCGRKVLQWLKGFMWKVILFCISFPLSLSAVNGPKAS